MKNQCVATKFWHMSAADQAKSLFIRAKDFKVLFLQAHSSVFLIVIHDFAHLHELVLAFHFSWKYAMLTDLLSTLLLQPLLALLDAPLATLAAFLRRPNTQRSLVQGSVLLVLLLLLWTVSVIAYAVFYAWYVPFPAQQFPLYLDYTMPGQPHVTVDLNQGSPVLAFNQEYDLLVQLHLPPTPRNEHVGLFMVQSELLSGEEMVVKQAKRPAMFPWKSMLEKWTRRFMALPGTLLLGWNEDQVVQVELLHHFTEPDVLHRVTHARISLLPVYASPTPSQSTALVVHPFSGQPLPLGIECVYATLLLRAHLSGLRYWMVQWKYITALLMISLFLAWSLGASIVAWRVLGQYMEQKKLALDEGLEHDLLQHDDRTEMERLRDELLDDQVGASDQEEQPHDQGVGIIGPGAGQDSPASTGYSMMDE